MIISDVETRIVCRKDSSPPMLIDDDFYLVITSVTYNLHPECSDPYCLLPFFVKHEIKIFLDKSSVDIDPIEREHLRKRGNNSQP